MREEHIYHLKQLLTSPKNIVIITHKNPDGDAIGSSLALYHYLQLGAHQVSVLVPNDYPDFLKWMPAHETICVFDANREKAARKIAEAAIIFTLDFNALSRVEDLEPLLEAAQASFVMIDHHPEPGAYATYTYTDTSMSSTCEMLYNFIGFMGDTGKITPEIATCLYTGIMTDTGSFRFPSTTSATHRVVADLIDKGAANAQIYNAVFDTTTFNKLQLLACALQTMKILPPHAAYITLSKEDLKKHHYKKGDTEGFVNYGLSVNGIKCSAIFIQNPGEDHIRISLRSKGNFSVNEIARRYFSGGGHLNAAGGKSYQSMEKTIETFKEIVTLYKHSLQEA